MAEITGTIGPDVLNGTEDPDQIFGNDGNDQISGLGGDDSINGQDGDDTVYGGNGNDYLTGDSSSSLGGNDTLYGEAGNDFLIGGNGTDYLSGGADDDTLRGGSAFDDFFADTLIGGDGNDTVYINGNDSADGGAGTDSLAVDLRFYAAGTTVDLTNVWSGGTGVNGTGTVTGFEQIYAFNGSAYADTLIVGLGFVGNTNFEIVGGGGADTIHGSNQGDTIYGFGGLYSSSSDDNTSDTLYGHGGSDSMNGNGGDDTLYGGDGDDYLNGEISGTSVGGNDSLYGEAGNDNLNGGDGVDLLDGGAGDDTLRGTDVFADTLLGGEGNDSLIFGANDSMDGGAGVDTLSIELAFSSAGTTIDLTNVWTGGTGVNGTGSITGVEQIYSFNGSAFGDTLIVGLGYVGNTNFEIVGGGGADTIHGSNQGDRLYGHVWNSASDDNAADTLYGYGGDDTLNGNGGDDTLYGGDGNDYLYGEPNGYGVTGNDTLYGEAGNDNLDGSAGNDLLDGGAGDDTLRGTDVFADTLLGGEGNDSLIFGANDSMDGGAGIDTLSIELAFSSAGTTIDLTNVWTGGTGVNGTGTITGVEQIYSFNGTSFADTLILGLGYVGNTNFNMQGGTGADIIHGSNQNDRIYGNATNSSTSDDSAADTLYGHGGDDAINGNGGNDTLFGGDGDDYLNGEINGTFETGNDTLYGEAGNDNLDGGEGNDLLDGGAGDDTLRGGAGDDIYVVDVLTDAIIENANSGADTVRSIISWTLGANLENLELIGGATMGVGNEADNIITGNNNNNLLNGGDGNDTLLGGAGVDTLNGASGDDILDGGTSADTMRGGSGNDTYFVNLATDVVEEQAASGTDSVNSSVAWTLSTNFENLTLIGGAAVNGSGNSAANVITGNLGANTLAGLGGNDTLIGGNGNDRLIGGAGADTLTGGAGNDTYQLTDALDTVAELAGEGTDTVQAYVDFTLGMNVERLFLYGGALVGVGNELANTIVGTGGANTLSGQAGNDYIYGGAGNDTINGGAGRDFLYGEAGADRFVFGDGDILGATSATADLIRDFSLTDGDTIDLSGMDAITGGADNAFSFIGTAAFSGAAGELRYQTSATGTTVMGDTNGDGAADFWIVLTGVHALDVADFWI